MTKEHKKKEKIEWAHERRKDTGMCVCVCV